MVPRLLNWRTASTLCISTPTRMVPLANAALMPLSISNGRISSPPPPARVLIKPANTPAPSMAAANQGSDRYSMENLTQAAKAKDTP